MTDQIGDMQEYVELNKEKKETEARLKEINDRMHMIEEPLVNWMAEAGITSMKIGSRTVYMHTQLWAGAPDVIDPATGEYIGKDYETANACLRAHGYGAFIEERFNTHRLSALIRELDRDDDLPETIHNGLKITERVSLRVRR